MNNLFKQSDLKYTDYIWKAIEGKDDPKISGEPDSTLFNRQQGHEVLYLINKYMENHYITDKNTGRKIEQIIREELPGDVRSQKRVVDYIERSFNFPLL